MKKMGSSLGTHDLRESGLPNRTAPAELASTSGPKRDYTPPELVVWGSMLNLTLGPAFLFDDVEGGGSEAL
jgi:hypothetical protein